MHDSGLRIGEIRTRRYRGSAENRRGGARVVGAGGSGTSFTFRRIRRIIIEVTPGDEAAVIGRLLNDCRATLRCWLNGGWHFTPLVQLPSRTDVLVEFPI